MTNLISISELIKLAKARNISLGNGDPEEHIFYLSKLGLLPKAVRRKTGEKLAGHYDLSVLDRLMEVNNLKNQGMTYSQMKFHFNQLPSVNSLGLINDSLPFRQSQFTDPSSPKLPFLSQPLYISPTTLFLIVGVVLGFLLSNRLQNSKADQTISLLPSKNVSVAGINQSADDKAMVKVLSTQDSTLDSETQSIYVISVPKSHFSNLDKVNLNF